MTIQTPSIFVIMKTYTLMTVLALALAVVAWSAFSANQVFGIGVLIYYSIGLLIAIRSIDWQIIQDARSTGNFSLHSKMALVGVCIWLIGGSALYGLAVLHEKLEAKKKSSSQSP